MSLNPELLRMLVGFVIGMFAIFICVRPPIAVAKFGTGVWVVRSLQPHQPGVRQVEEVSVKVLVVGTIEVVLSKHPHHPGVLHVSVRVMVLLLVLLLLLLLLGGLDVFSVPLLSRNFHL